MLGVKPIEAGITERPTAVGPTEEPDVSHLVAAPAPEPPKLPAPRHDAVVVSLSYDGGATSSSLVRSARVGERGTSVVPEIIEGDYFRVRVRFSGVEPDGGTCSLGVNDSHGYVSSATARHLQGGDGATVQITTQHDNREESGRSIAVTIDSCDLRDAAGEALPVTIRDGSVTVRVNTAGPVQTFASSYTATVATGHPASVTEGEEIRFTVDFSPALPEARRGYVCIGARLKVRIVDSEQGHLYEFFHNEPNGRTTGGRSHGTADTEAVSTDRSVTISITEFEAGHCLNFASGATLFYPGTYSIGSPSSVTVGIVDSES